ncbi:MAG TPA: hypothetical protein VMB23_01025, partial [Spirochaetia bacterium]|nr:hypothetical protein [Spirochaetia bacterium]
GAVTDKFLPGMTVRTEVLDTRLASSPALLNALAPALGYDRVAALAPRLASEPPSSLTELRNLLSAELGLTIEEAERLVDPLVLAQGRGGMR